SKIYCEFDEFSMDNELNQFFLYAINTLMNYTKNKKLLKMCKLVLDEVSFKKFDIDNLHIHFNRLNNRFKDSFEFALLLLKKSIPVFEKDKKSFAFLFDMNELFEDFIGNIYKSIDSSTILQNERNFGNLKLIPDVVCDDLIIDIKYKLVEDKKKLSRDDKYQMFVYGTNFGIKDTMLLYPEHRNKKVNEDLKLGKDDKMIELKMRSIDLDFDGGYDEYIYEIKNRLENINES
ncbi:MAG: restriction endonuclease, partial [Arcobacteraceae bacterium]|nr:restriction endonuclease [Arcobacteraceae bacterium]